MIIGITGYKQSGKNTVAKMLQYLLLCKCGAIVDTSYKEFQFFKNEHCFCVGAPIVAFADSLKKVVSAITGCHLGSLEEEDFKNSLVPDYLDEIFQDKETYHTYRELLQYLGTDIFRKLCENIWVEALLHRLNSNSNTTYIVSDVRFPNEAEAITNMSPVNFIIKVIRGNSVSTDMHPSETSVDLVKAKYIIRNDGTEEDLFNTVKAIVEEVNPISEDFEQISREVEYGVTPELDVEN